MTRIIVNAIGFNIGWFGSVFASANDRPLLALIAVALVLLANFAISPIWKRDLLAVIVVAIPGAILDTALTAAGVLTLDGSLLIGSLWLLGLWLNFAETLQVALRFLVGKPILAAALGLVGGPSTYYAGAKLGALGLHENLTLALGVLAVEWALVMPIAVWLSARIRDDQRREDGSRDYP